ncbi:hypothetical protein QBC37DRAFT_390737 [Rhypophila decipiens]|uniref:Uncharacterized protein n=1 Tax=Rhypophila decipiens TaxID=261697 RepID=A0AAN6Y2H2_9PEZI|nr:hypothetical protein QBC37DRAFT_390737 [Rhypophila decipiens]
MDAIRSGAELGTKEWLPDAGIEDIFLHGKGSGPHENPPRMHPRNKWWMVLDNEELCDFETQSSATRENKDDSWMRVYEILPELAAPSMDRRVDVEMIRDWVMDHTGDLESAEEDDWEVRCLRSRSSGEDGQSKLKDDMENTGKEVDGLDEVAVEDDTENEESQVHLLWRDAKGNIIKETYTNIRILSWLQDNIGRLLLSETPLWTESGLGKLS